jgi:hypothetical protein
MVGSPHAYDRSYSRGLALATPARTSKSGRREAHQEEGAIAQPALGQASIA